MRSSRERLNRDAGLVLEEGDGATSFLLLFYATECGLKERLLVRCGGRSTEAVASYGHDLRKMAKELKLPASVWRRLSDLDGCRLRCQGQGDIAFKELHQAWRYGAKLDPRAERAVVALLRELISWCEKD